MVYTNNDWLSSNCQLPVRPTIQLVSLGIRHGLALLTSARRALSSLLSHWYEYKETTRHYSDGQKKVVTNVRTEVIALLLEHSSTMWQPAVCYYALAERRLLSWREALAALRS